MLAEFLLPAPRVQVSGRQGNPMPKDWPETHIQRIVGTADLPASETSSAIAVETATHNLVFRAGGSTRKAIDNASDQTVAGAKTFTGSNAFSGAVAFTGTVAGLRQSVSVTLADTIAITAAMSGTTFIATKTTATQVFTLPAAATAGLVYTFVAGAGSAGGEIRIGVQTGDNIVGKTSGAQDGTALVSTVTTGLLLNTAAGNVAGDGTTLVSDGITTWYMVGPTGAWTVT